MAEILDINLEADLSEFSSTVDVDGDMTQAGAAALGGTSGGLQLIVDDTNVMYGQNTFTTFGTHTHRYRFYIDPNNMTMGSGDDMEILALAQTGYDKQSICELHHDGSNYEIRAGVGNDSGVEQFTSYYDITDAEHCVEVRVVAATGSSTNDGTLDLWIDGNHQEQVTAIDLYDTNNYLGMSRLGAQSISAGISGTFYLDEFVLRDDGTLIGCLALQSASISPSASLSPSASVSPSISPSASVSPSASESASPSPGATGEVCWGHDTGVLEANVRDFQNNWAGTGTIENPGGGDVESIKLIPGQYMISEMVDTGTVNVQLLQNEYDITGDDVTLEYRHGATPNQCAAAGWNNYAAPFSSAGYVEIRLTSTL